jgi:hypothetical protein
MKIKGGYLQEKPDWFNPTKYDAFKPIDGKVDEEIRKTWSRALFIRICLLLPTWPSDSKAECIERLIVNPLDDCGFGNVGYCANKEYFWDDVESESITERTHHDKIHPYGQSVISPTRFGQIANIVSLEDLQQRDCLDDLYSPQNEEKLAFLTVNLDASDELLKKDFSKWLTGIRQYREYEPNFTATPDKLIEKWSAYGVMECIDLTLLIGPAKGLTISRKKVMEWSNVHASRKHQKFIDTTLPLAIKLALKWQTPFYLTPA